MIRMRHNLSCSRTTGISAPGDVGGLAAWWKADSLALVDGNAVANWTDSTGNGHTATQATGAQQPLYKTAKFTKGNPGVQFDAVDDVLGITAFPGVITHSIVAVCNGITTGDQRRIMMQTAQPTRFLINASAGYVLNQQDLLSVNANSSALGGAFSTQTLLSVSILSGGNIAFYEGKTARGSAAWTGVTNFSYDLIGPALAGTGLFVLGELCVYSKALSAQDISDLYDYYFVPKYGAL